MSPRLRLEHITKAYPGIVANNDISLDVAPGEVLAILGENGAGKSTLMKIIFGSVKPDRGTIEFDGRAVQVMLTPEGKKVEAFHRRCHRRIIAEICEDLSEEEREELLRTMTRINSYFQTKL